MEDATAGPNNKTKNNSILLFRMGRMVCFGLLRAAGPFAEYELNEEWMKFNEAKEVWWMELICFLLSFFWWVMGGGTANGSAERKRTKQKSKLMEFNQTKAKERERSREKARVEGFDWI